MKKFAFLLVLIMGFGIVYAQDDAISDEELKAYAIANAAVKSITSTISPMVNGLIEKQEGMTGQRFKELQGTKGDEGKLAAIEAKDWEIQFLNTVNTEIDKRKDAAKEIINLMAKYAIGTSNYKAIKAGLKSDDALKSRYEAISASL